MEVTRGSTTNDRWYFYALQSLAIDSKISLVGDAPEAHQTPICRFGQVRKQ